jgi:apolipoprotein N-acyltransferase
MPASRPALARILAPIAAGLLHAVLMLGAFPPVDLWPLTVLAPVPLIWAGLRLRDRWMPLLVGLGVFPFWAYQECWVTDISALGYVPMAAILALFYGFFVWLLARCARRTDSPALLALATPVLWTAVEVLRGEVTFTGYPWFLIAHPLVAVPALASPAAVLGTYWVSLLVSALAGIIALGVTVQREARPRWGVLAAAAAVVVAAWAGTGLVAGRAEPTEPPLRVAVVQTNLPQSNKMAWPLKDRLASFDRFAQLTEKGAAAKPDLIVWPETMYPGDVLDPWVQAELDRLMTAGQLDRDSLGLLPMYRALLALQERTGVPMLIGALGMDRAASADQRAAQHNSVFLIVRGAIAPNRYDKLHLTPFGEVMPYIQYWPWLQKQLLDFAAGGMSFDLVPGKAPRVFDLPSNPRVAIATPICFEATSASVCRELARAAADRPLVMINLTNDGWFGRFDPGRWEHLQAARWRAVELGIPVIRAANTGVSAVIDRRGRLLKAGTDGGALVRAEGVLTADVIPAKASTIFTRVGYVCTWSILALAGLISFWTFIRRPHERSTP